MLTVAIAMGPSSHAASLTLFTDASPATPLIFTPQGVAHPLLVKIVNAVAADPPSEFLSAWQLRLQLLPDPSAIGTLNFAAATEPDAYVFDGTGHFGPSISAAGTGVFAADFNFPASGGVKAPPAPGTGLLSITFAPSAGALGRFGVYALAGLGNSEWTDATDPVQQRRTFANIPDAGGPVRIADLLVTYAADFDHDLDVDAADLAQWKGDFALNGDSDSDGEGDSDGADFLTWQSELGSSKPATAASAPIPEPATLTMLLMAVLAIRQREPKRAGNVPCRALCSINAKGLSSRQGPSLSQR